MRFYMVELNYQFRERLSEIHRPNRWDKTKTLLENQVAITESWTITVPADADEVAIEQAARNDAKVLAAVGDKTIAKCIVVKGKIINLIVK